MDNLNATQVDQIKDPTSLQSRKDKALAILDKFEELFDEWYLYEDEVLTCRDDFFNHKPPAVINLTNDEIKRLNSRRKAVLYSFRIKDERWAAIIDSIQTQERREKGLEKVAKSLVEKTKTKSSNQVVEEKKKKLAKALGISVQELEKREAEDRKQKFGELVGTKVVEKALTGETSSGILHQLQEKVKANLAGSSPTPVSAAGQRCPNCKKFTCICKK